MRLLADHDVLNGGHVAEEANVLKGAGDAQTRNPVGGTAVEAVAIKEYIALVNLIEAGDAVEKGRLARAIGTDDADDALARNSKIHVS